MPEWIAPPGSLRVRRIQPRYLSSIDSVDLPEVGRQLGIPGCPACGAILPEDTIRNLDVYGGKSFTYRVRLCTWCTWWKMFKFAENPRSGEIYWAQALAPATAEFTTFKDLRAATERTAGYDLVPLLARDPGRLRDIHWKGFQNLVGAFFEDMGFKVRDVSTTRNSACDFLIVDAEGAVYALEVKHTSVTGVDPIWKLRAVVDRAGELSGGWIVVSGRFTDSAIQLIDTGIVGPYQLSAEAPQKPMWRTDLSGVAAWLEKYEGAFEREVWATLETVFASEAMSEM